MNACASIQGNTLFKFPFIIREVTKDQSTFTNKKTLLFHNTYDVT